MLAKYYGITVLNQSYKVCNLAQRMGKQCPIPAGKNINNILILHMQFIMSLKWCHF